MTHGGITVTTRTKFIGIRIPLKIPKAAIGMIGLVALAKKATAVVLEVIDMALEDLLKV